MRPRTRLVLSLVELMIALGIAAGAFYVAFETITDLMVRLGMPARRARWVSPLVEAFILAGSLEAVLRAHECDRDVRFPRLLVAGACTVSVALNVADMAKQHAEWLAWAASALAPFCQLCGLDLALGRIRRLAGERGAAPATIAGRRPSGRAERLLGTLAQLAAAVRGTPGPAGVPGAEAPALTATPTGTTGAAESTIVPRAGRGASAAGARRNGTRPGGLGPASGENDADVRARARALYEAHRSISGAELGRAVGRSDSYGRRLRREFQAATDGTGGTATVEDPGVAPGPEPESDRHPSVEPPTSPAAAGPRGGPLRVPIATAVGAAPWHEDGRDG